jgi:putative DNA primase/helicase
LAVPSFAHVEGRFTDFNDLHLAGGIERTAEGLKKVERQIIGAIEAHLRREASRESVAGVFGGDTSGVSESQPTDDAAFNAEEREGADEESDGDLPPKYSEDAIAVHFSTEHRDDLRYVANWGQWLEWDGRKWRADSTLRAYDLARIVCRRIAADETLKDNAKKAIASARTIAAVERMARSDRSHAATEAQWDTDIWLLNTPGGTVDLRTGRMRPHQRKDYITKSTAAAPGGECPIWRAFLEKITGGDKQLELFLQRVAGYGLTGSTDEHAMFFCYGTGGNGKGVFLNTITDIMGDYAKTAPMETFTASNTERHPTELAGLRGARLITAQETEEGRRWAESKIKALTGGDKISARFMRQDFFEYQPQFKLLIAGNHKPGLRGVDEAIRRRMNLIPFTVAIPEEEKDKKLPEKLRAEWPGILQWMIDGCAEWQGEGLAQPEAVRKATDDYLRDEDSVAEWISECCTTGTKDTAFSSALFNSWSKWAERAGEFVGSNKALSKKLEKRGFVKEDTRVGARFRGLAVVPEQEPPSWEPPV